MRLATTEETTPGGRRLRVARLGTGPPLVLLHGYPDNLQIWCELAPRLADRLSQDARLAGDGLQRGLAGGRPRSTWPTVSSLLDSWASAGSPSRAWTWGASPPSFAAGIPTGSATWSS